MASLILINFILTIISKLPLIFLASPPSNSLAPGALLSPGESREALGEGGGRGGGGGEGRRGRGEEQDRGGVKEGGIESVDGRLTWLTNLSTLS